jgi:hypothetical protein
MRVQRNKNTGEYHVDLGDGTWVPAKMQRNKQTGEMRVFANGQYYPYGMKGEGQQSATSAESPEPSSSAAPPEQEPSLLSSFGRHLGLTGRSALEGAASLGDLLAAPANAINAKLGGDPEYFKNPGRIIADAFDMPAPETQGERLAGDVTRAVASIAGGYGLGGALNAAGRAPAFAKMLQSALPAQVAASAAAGLSSGVARESGGGMGTQLAAGLVGGVLPGAGYGALRTAGRGLSAGRGFIEALNPGGRDRIAGRVLNNTVGDGREAMIDALRNGADAEYVPGSLPTLAQATGNRGLAVLEKGLASSGMEGSALQERYMAQNQARQAAVRQGLAEQAPYGGTLSTDDVGTRIRTAFDANHSGAKAKTRAAYDAIDPAGTTSFDLDPLMQKFQQSIGGGRYTRIPSEVGSFMRQMHDDIQKGVNASYRDLQDMRTTFTDMAESAARTGDAPTARIAGNLKRDIDEYLESASQNPGTGFSPDQATRFKEAKYLRTVQGKRFESGANDKMSRRGKSLEGQHVPTNLVPELYFKGGEVGAENMRAFTLSVGGNADARSAMRDYAVKRAAKGATRIARGDEVVDLDALDRWLRTYSPALKQLGMRNIADTPKIQAVKTDRAKATRAEQLAAVRGSPTAQNLATQDIIDRFIGDRRVDASTGTAGSLAASIAKAAPNLVLSKISDMFLKSPNEAVKKILIDAMLDPQRALRLMENARYAPATPLTDILKRQAVGYGATAVRLPGSLLAGEREE